MHYPETTRAPGGARVGVAAEGRARCAGLLAGDRADDLRAFSG